MTLDGDLHALEKERDRETALLRARLGTLADTIERDASPAQWVREHPYIATGGAALAGFALAQAPVAHVAGVIRAVAAKAAPAPAPVQSTTAPSTAPTPAPAGFAWGEILGLVVTLAQQYLMPPASARDDHPPAGVDIANAGAVSGDTFPPTVFRAKAHDDGRKAGATSTTQQ